jgi:peptidoglycan hydrolase-like protein with peptidoglycan-binding domain
VASGLRAARFSAVRRVLTGIVAVVLAGGLIAGAYVLGSRATETKMVVPQVAAPAVLTTRSGTLEEVRQVQMSAQWQTDRSLIGRSAGTVTSLMLEQRKGTEVQEGAVLYSVDGNSVMAITGDQPAYRAIRSGTKGADVAQVQSFLERAGFQIGAVDGEWGAASVAAWKQWLKASKLPESGEIELGAVIFVPGLPRIVAPAEGLQLGNVVGGSDKAVLLLAQTPTLFLDLPKEAATSIAVGVKLDAKLGGHAVTATVSARRAATETGVRIEFDLGSGCAEWCGDVPLGQPTTFAGTLHLAPSVTGTLVPVGAFRSGAGDATTVVLANGTVREVKVLAKVGAQAVVEGLEPGEQIQLPEAPAQAPSSTSVAPK